MNSYWFSRGAPGQTVKIAKKSARRENEMSPEQLSTLSRDTAPICVLRTEGAKRKWQIIRCFGSSNVFTYGLIVWIMHIQRNVKRQLVSAQGVLENRKKYVCFVRVTGEQPRQCDTQPTVTHSRWNTAACQFNSVTCIHLNYRFWYRHSSHFTKNVSDDKRRWNNQN